MEDLVEPLGPAAEEAALKADGNLVGGAAPSSEFREFRELFSGQRKRSDCEFTLLKNNMGHATKVFRLDDKGALSTLSAANIYEGEAERVSISGLGELKALIEKLPSSAALCFGTAQKPKARLLTQETLRAGSYADAIARDREHFSFRRGQPGILMLDCDARPGKPALDWPDIDRVIGDIVPGWADVERLWRASSSAFIYTSDGSELIGTGGWRCYVMLDDAAAIPAVGAHIYQRLWETGHGYIFISKAGHALDRSLIDATVWQPERVDFAGEPVLERGLVRRAPQPTLLGSTPMLASARAMAALTLGEWRQSSELLKQAKQAVEPEVTAARRSFVAARADALTAEKLNVSEKRLRSLWKRAVEHQVLTGDFVLHREDGNTITVGEVLADVDRWHQARFADPLEPDYRGDKRIALVNLEPELGSEPYLYSHAHGGIIYRLAREASEIILQTGERPRAVDATLSVIRQRGELYERGGEMVRLAADTIEPVTAPWLSDYLGRHIRFITTKFAHEEWVKEPADPPPWLCLQTNAKSGERGLRELTAIITAPTLRLNGSILSTPGYDADTGLLLKGSGWPKIPEAPKPGKLPEVFKVLWRPFKDFPFVTKEDRGVMVACILTAAVRRSLPRAPAFSFDAPAAGTGKTLLGQCMLRLCGSPPDMVPECRDEEELRKRLLSALRHGRPGILLDNIRGQFGSAALEGFLTSELYTDRVLGVSQMLSLPTNVLFLISGNNFQPKGDLYRRILTCRIDAKTDAPERRTFKIEPLEYCHEHRQRLVAAALVLLRGFISAGQPRTTRDRLASYERWDDLIRQCVLWMAREGTADLGDPTACIERAKEQEPERQKLAAFLEATAAAMRDQQWRVSDLIKKAESDSGGSRDIGRFRCNEDNGRLHAALEEIAGDRGNINPRILGRWIERHADNRCAGYYLERAGTRQHAMVWRIRTYDSLPLPF